MRPSVENKSGGTHERTHTHAPMHGFHAGAHMQKYENLGWSILTHAGLTPAPTCGYETITHPPLGMSKRRPGMLKCPILMVL